MFRQSCFMLLVFACLNVVFAQEQNNQLALETVARINEWRITEGIWPLKVNPVLTDMAISHAQYLVSLDELPTDLHAGQTGLNPRERALLEPFEWPHYQLPEQIAIGENAGIGTLDYAMGFWEQSEIHSATSLNPSYREIGVAAVPFKGGHIFIVVFGSRPNILPALLDPIDGQTIYLTDEVFQYAAFHNSVKSAIEIQMFDFEGQPLFDVPQTWSPTITIPDDAGDTIYLLITDGDREVLSRVNRVTDQVVLLGSSSESEVEEATATPIPTMPIATPQLDLTEQPQQIIPSVEATIVPTVVPAINEPDMLILYTADTLDILNVSGETANWETLELRGIVTVPFTQFAKVTDVDLTAFPDRHCLQIRSNSVVGDVVKAESCRWVRSLVTVQSDRLFWLIDKFDVYQNGASVGTCSSEDNICEIRFDS